MSEDEIKHILEDIDTQGFPLEVATSQVLEAYGWEVTNQVAYLDYEQQKFRTVDIVASRNLILEPDKLGFDLYLVIECKKTTKPWVFYASDYDLDQPEMRRKTAASGQFFICELAYQKNLPKDFMI